MMIHKVIDTMTRLRGFFAGAPILLGGSTALKQLGMDLDPRDVDIYILTPRRYETWALEIVLKQIFEEVVPSGNIEIPKYNMESIYKRVQCIKEGVSYDIILMNTTISDLCNRESGSTFGSIYYGLTYNEFKPLQLCDNSKSHVEKLKDGYWDMATRRCTDEYVNKVKNVYSKALRDVKWN